MGRGLTLTSCLSAVHGRGMRLVLDMVLNHTSDEHPWFREALRRQRQQRARLLYCSDGDEARVGVSPPNQLAIDDRSSWLAS
jgi:glycosidase